MAGLPGTGKSTLCRALATEQHGVVLDKDIIRAAIFPRERIEYSARQDDFCQSVMFQTAAYLLNQDSDALIFIDGRTFSRRYQLEEAIGSAVKLRSAWRIIECTCSEESARWRIEQDRELGRHPAGNRSFELYRRLKAEFEPIVAAKLVVDTDQPIEKCLAAARVYIETADQRT